MPVVAPRPRAATLGAPRPGRPSRVARPARRPAPRSSASAEPATEESDPAAPPPTPPSGAAEDSTPSVARAKLNAGIAGFYDASTGLWEDIWGDHLHHGYYPTDGSPQPRSNREAQVEMVERVVGWAGVGRAADGSGAPLPVRRALDVGCGLGGSARHLAAALGCAAEGVTLSPVQAARGNELSAAAGLGCVFSAAEGSPHARANLIASLHPPAPSPLRPSAPPPAPQRPRRPPRRRRARAPLPRRRL
jgi:hypothetical protein